MEFPTNFIWASKVFADFDNIVPALTYEKALQLPNQLPTEN